MFFEGAGMVMTCVVGLQWGDEAKGKIVDLLADKHDYAIRFNGGANAGHTVVWEDRSFKLSLLPTGILKSHITAVIGNGVVVFPPRLIEEIENLRAAGVHIAENLQLSDQAHLIMPYHIEEERLVESWATGKIGTTGRGIGPCYQDKVGRRFALRVGDLLDLEHFRQKLEAIIPIKNRLLQALGSEAQLSVELIMEDYERFATVLRPYITNTRQQLQQAWDEQKSFLFEAAQGALLDVDHGSYPFVTSSHSLPSGVWSGTGISARKLDRIIGVVKAYTTRVGEGPLPTELHDERGEQIRRVGKEFGTVTGRPRRIGWFDAVATRYTSRLADVDEITLMLLDVLSHIPEISLCTAYEIDGRLITDFPSDATTLARCRPVYETLPGWEADLTRCRSWEDLPNAAQKYVRRVEQLLEKPISIVSVGPDRAATISLVSS